MKYTKRKMVILLLGVLICVQYKETVFKYMQLLNESKTASKKEPLSKETVFKYMQLLNESKTASKKEPLSKETVFKHMQLLNESKTASKKEPLSKDLGKHDTTTTNIPFTTNKKNVQAHLSSEGRDKTVNIAFIVDAKHIQALPTAINSIWKTSNRTVRIFVFFTKGNMSKPSQYLTCYLGDLTTKNIHVKVVNTSNYMDREVYGHMNRRKVNRYTAKASNYMRFYLHKLLPRTIHHVLYLDVDLVVVQDVGTLWDECLNHNTTISGVVREVIEPHLNTTDAQNITCSPAAWGLKKLGLTLPNTFSGLNMGIVFINVLRLRMRERIFYRRLLVWSSGDTRYRWFTLDTQILMAYVFYGEMTSVDPAWNTPHNEDPTLCPYPAIIHYAGEVKPWENSTAVQRYNFWEQYQVQACSGNGKCVQKTKPHCKCKPGYAGNLCKIYAVT